jgi:hypothetical protein
MTFLQGYMRMDTTYDIFQRLSDAGPPLWIETVSSLEQAKQRLAALSSQEPGAYMVFDLRLGSFVEPLDGLPSRPITARPGRFSIVHN